MFSPGNSARQLLLALWAATSALFAGGKISPDLAKSKAGIVGILVQYRSAPSTTNVSNISTRHRGTVKRVHQESRALEVSLPSTELTNLAADPDVVYVSADRPLRANMIYAGPTVGTVSALFQGVRGEGIAVAVIDSGVNEHQDLAGRIVYAESFIGKLGTSKDAVADQFGHGTIVAGVAAGSGEASGLLTPLRGIAPASKSSASKRWMPKARVRTRR
ncbi:MAG: hypothetical protein FJW31_00960 [Acidobacteria bacterium]|nr:hypothetical protein [Acidobacteriota bacterium]